MSFFYTLSTPWRFAKVENRHNEARKVLLLFFNRIPGAWLNVRAERRQGRCALSRGHWHASCSRWNTKCLLMLTSAFDINPSASGSVAANAARTTRWDATRARSSGPRPLERLPARRWQSTQPLSLKSDATSPSATTETSWLRRCEPSRKFRQSVWPARRHSTRTGKCHIRCILCMALLLWKSD